MTRVLGDSVAVRLTDTFPPGELIANGTMTVAVTRDAAHRGRRREDTVEACQTAVTVASV